jgi:hypothetical protein
LIFFLKIEENLSLSFFDALHLSAAASDSSGMFLSPLLKEIGALVGIAVGGGEITGLGSGSENVDPLVSATGEDLLRGSGGDDGGDGANAGL